MTSLRRALVLAIVAGLALSACGSDDDKTTSSEGAATTATTASTTDAYGYGASSSTTTAAAAAGGATIKAASSNLGSILVDAEGRTLYVFTRDTANKSTCVGACEQTWPPLFAENVTAGPGADSAKIGTTTSRDGGKAQAVYNGRPLYRFSGDTAAGQTNGQGVGGNWFVVSPTGEPVK